MNPPSSWSFFSLQPFVLRRGRGGRRNGAALVSGLRSGLRRRATRRGPALAGPGDRGPRRYAPTAQVPEGQLEPVVFHDLPGAADDHVVPLAGRRDQPDLAVRGTFDRVGGKSRLRVVEPGGRLLFVADDEPERVRPLARRLELRAHLLAAAAQDRDQATDVDLPAVGRAHPQHGQDGQDDQDEDAEERPLVLGQEARRPGYGDVHRHVAVDKARVGGVDGLDLEPGGAGGRVLIDGDRERDAGRLPGPGRYRAGRAGDDAGPVARGQLKAHAAGGAGLVDEVSLSGDALADLHAVHDRELHVDRETRHGRADLNGRGHLGGVQAVAGRGAGERQRARLLRGGERALEVANAGRGTGCLARAGDRDRGRPAQRGPAGPPRRSLPPAVVPAWTGR